MIFDTKYYYIGEFRYGRGFHGYGKLCKHDGSYKEGKFEDGKFVGPWVEDPEIDENVDKNFPLLA